ncbi:MAG: hypothetical protein J6B68_01780 [Lachnospiraceae bacterium]|nr:hypothetical protein [Lachnospiraceae bacterium]MBP3477577.1 hypothetical protein [Lachnospiraceae bacterium]
MSRVLPILFNADMIRAILDGRKTVTRRVCKDGNEYTVPDMSFYDEDKRTYAVHNYADKEHIDKLSLAERTCPICPGDILYVRETWNYVYNMDDNDQSIEGTGRYIYYADDPMPFSHWVDTDTGEHKEQMPWRPSIHMPKEAARIWLKVTNVRVERLQDMDCEDAMKEGIDPRCCINLNHTVVKFSKLWNSTLKKSDLDRYGWDANPWVWVIEFKRCEKPESEGI